MVRGLRAQKRSIKTAALAVLLVAGAGCSRTGVDRALSLGEGFWQKGQYQQAVQEFEKVATRDPHSPKGLIALFRAAEIQAQFTTQYAESVRKLRLFLERSQSHPSTSAALEGAQAAALRQRARELIGETLFLRMEDYEAARAHYQGQLAAEPNSERAVEWMLKVAKCDRFLGRHAAAERVLRDLIARYPIAASPGLSETGERAAAAIEARYELAETLVLQGKFAEAEKEYQSFIARFPQSAWVNLAKMGLANCYEERRQWDAALQLYREVRDRVPSPPVVDIRVSRILERLRKRGDEP